MSLARLRIDPPLRPCPGPEAGDDGGHDARRLREALSGNGWSPLRSGGPRLGRGLQTARSPYADAGTLSLRRGDTPWSGRADGGAVGAASGLGRHGGPRFDQAVGPGGYGWWYVDALSDDGRFGLTIIAFVGSVFSPWYAWSGRQRPEDHCALNIAFYGPGCERWAMTERPKGQVWRDAESLSIGPSSLRWDGDDLVIRFDEITAPVPPMPMIPSGLRGVVRVKPRAINTIAFPLDAQGRHVWRPIAPRARVEVTLDDPALSWSGEGYLDTNAGTEPLEDAFEVWDWSRAHVKHDSAVLYDLKRKDGSALSLALRFDKHGVPETVTPPPHAPLPSTVWRMPRHTRADEGRSVSVQRTWEDTPFYSRSTLSTHLLGQPCQAVHESLSLGRLRSPLVRAMLPFRMPRSLR